jgi:DNA-binding response OmpR family regulator
VRKAALQGPPRVLIVTDQPLANFVALTLNHGMYKTRSVETTEAGQEELREWRPHLLVVDVDSERIDALDLIGQRIARRRLPTIALTRRGDLKTKLAAFEQGADDIVTVPFAPEELVARVLALMRRTYGEGVRFEPVIKVAGLEIDLLEQRVKSGTSEVRLTSLELALLYLLASNPGQTLARDEILDALWGADYVAESNVVDRHIRNLRKKLGKNARFIGTVPGKGYRFLQTK